MARRTLLLVDSHDSARRALAALLRECGYSVLEAHNGMEGFRVARERHPELVIVDLWPFFSASVQMVERMRGTGAAAQIPVLVLTSVVSPEYRARALAAGCAGYLEKPSPAEVVLAEVRRILEPPPSAAAPAPLAGVAVG